MRPEYGIFKMLSREEGPPPGTDWEYLLADPTGGA